MKKSITRRDLLKKSSQMAAATSLSGCGLLLKGCSSKQEFDIVIKEGIIYDGLGNKPIKTDIGITGDRIKKMTSIPAQKFGFTDRGEIERGCFADIVIFDEKRVIDKASWVEPHQYSEGIEYVLVNGEVVIERGGHTEKYPGRILKKQARV